MIREGILGHTEATPGSKVFLISWTKESWGCPFRFTCMTCKPGSGNEILEQIWNWMKSTFYTSILPICVPYGETTPSPARPLMLVTTKSGCVRGWVGRKPDYKEVVMWGSCGSWRLTAPYRHTLQPHIDLRGGHTLPRAIWGNKTPHIYMKLPT